MSEKTYKAPVQVVMPEVKLTVADLAYMTGLMPGATRCRGGGKVTDKLVFLGLIEFAEIPACPKAMAAHQKKEADNRAALKIAVRDGNWDKAFSIGNDWNYSRRNGPKETKDFRLTKSGREFMAKGRAMSATSTKAACL